MVLIPKWDYIAEIEMGTLLCQQCARELQSLHCAQFHGKFTFTKLRQHNFK